MFNRSFWRGTDENEVLISNINNAEFLKESPLLNYNGEIWTVEKLLNEIERITAEG